MGEREVSNGGHVHVCPTCGSRLDKQGELFVCVHHGAFFAYGPHLLVRAPGDTITLPEAPMPWENSTSAPPR